MTSLHANTPTPSTPAFAPQAGEHWIEPLDDGGHVLIRPLRAEDRAREKAFIMRLSPESRHFRFLCQIKEPSEAMLDQLMDIDHHDNMAYVALAHVDGELREVGISRYAACDQAGECECAVTVDDQWKRRGLGALLLGHLIDKARANGFKAMHSVDSATNAEMQDLARDFGFSTVRDPNNACQVIHRLQLTD
ncbi:GNAT family N-acetyltransferase [Pseudomonas alkylphenolica]|uniref:GNAT family N-acetyltransferase n=1 Tax=Pseudomonas alkylphenolica TaxID=237609 RepID=A0A443ZEU1_9PSED|nr:GNAT family N-acetyltransferase [Pseudomonas alkylphenolica]RWU17143.1 GNAT family N-acetyltransferase [Pseudomonas alkylphenolica]